MAGLRRSRQTQNIPTWFCRLREVRLCPSPFFLWILSHPGVLPQEMCCCVMVAWCSGFIFVIFLIDKTLIVWKLTRDEGQYGVPEKRLYGHSHFISDVVLSSDGNYALSGSWDKTLRLWDLAAGKTTRRFEDHTKVWQEFVFFVNLITPDLKQLEDFLLSRSCNCVRRLKSWTGLGEREYGGRRWIAHFLLYFWVYFVYVRGKFVGLLQQVLFFW